MAPIANLTVRISAQIAELEKGLDTANRKLDGFGKQFSSVASVAKLAGGALAAAFTVDTIVAFGTELVRMADDVQRVSDRTGLLTSEVQKLSFIAGQSGNSLDELTGAIGLMQKRMDDPEFLGALDRIGISFEQFRTQSPFQQLQQIAGAFKDITDPADQAQRATELFGRTGIAIIPTLRAEFEKLGNEAPLLTDKQIKALDALGDSWEKLKLQAKVAAGNVILNLADMAKSGNIYFLGAHVDIQRAKADFQEISDWVSILTGRLEKLPQVKVSQSVQNIFGGSGVPKIKLTPDDIAGIESELNKEREALDKASKAADTHRQAIQALADKYSGVTLARQVRDLSEAIKLLKPGTNLKALAEDIGKLFREGAKLTPEMIQIGIAFNTLLPKVEVGIRDFDDLGESVAGVTIPAKRFSELLPEVESGIGDLVNILPKLDLGYQFAQAKPKADEFNHTLGDLSQSLSQLGQVAGGAFSEIARGLATLVNAADTANKSLKALKEGQEDWKAGSTFQGILGMTTGVLGLVSAAITAGKALANLFDRNKGRDLVVDFAETFGGFDALHEKLLTLGEAGEALWIKLTQGVGRNNPAQARAVIDEVTAALNKQESQQDETTAATEEQAQATIETASQAAQALDELGDKLRTNEDDWARWSDTVTGDIQQIADALRGLNIPSPGASSGGGGGEEAPGAYTGGIMSAGRIIASHFGTGGIAGRLVQFSPRGADRYPAMLADGEGVLNRRAMAALGAANLHALNSGRLSTLGSGIDASAGPMQSVAILEVDGREFARALVPVYPGETRRYGVRVRAS